MSISESNRLRAVFAGLVLWAAGTSSVLAADAPKPPKGPPPGSSVEMPYLIAPLNDGDALVAYAYISSKIIVSSPAFAVDVRDKIPFIQDAFVRDVNTKGIGKSDSPQTVDKDALAARLLADAQKVMKPGTVISVQLVDVQIRPTHPQPINPDGPS